MPISRNITTLVLLLSVILELFVQGCATSTANVGPLSVMIVTREDTVRVRAAAGFPSFEVTVVATNQGDETVYLSTCRVEASRLINGRWVTVYQPVCTGVGPIYTIAPSDSAVFAMTISSFATVEATPPNAIVAEGVYKLVFGIGRGQPPNEPPSPGSYVATASSSFVVEQ